MINEVLELGPKNLQALKFKALIYGLRGMFTLEKKIWKKVAEIDPADSSALHYFYRAFIEEKEYEYFTDTLPSGGRRYLANPRAMVNPSFVGLIGCTSFLLLSNLARTHLILATPLVSMSLFMLLVIGPWLYIIWTFMHTLKDVIISPAGITVRSRLKSYRFLWSEVEDAYIVAESPYASMEILLILKLRDRQHEPIAITIGENATVRAPSFLVADLVTFFRKPKHTAAESSPVARESCLTF